MRSSRSLSRLGLCLTVAGSALYATHCAAAPLPPVVEAAIAEQMAICAPEKSTLSKGFLTRRDVNRDGVEDFVLDYGRFRCGDRAAFFCGTAGCTTQVFASVRGGHAKVLDFNVRDIRFKTVGGKPAMLLGLHGSSCDRIGVETCFKTTLWNGRTFKLQR